MGRSKTFFKPAWETGKKQPQPFARTPKPQLLHAAHLAEVVPRWVPGPFLGSPLAAALENHPNSSRIASKIPREFCFPLGLPWDGHVSLHGLQHFPFRAAP